MAYVFENDCWWRIDDHHVSGVLILSEVFENGQSPVLLLYRINTTTKHEVDKDSGNPPERRSK